MWVSVGGVGSTDHVATYVSLKAQEEVQMTRTINSKTKEHLKPNSSTCIAARHVLQHGKKRSKAKQHLGKAKENGWFRAALQRGQGRYCSPPAGKDSIDVQSVDFPRATIMRFDSSSPLQIQNVLLYERAMSLCQYRNAISVVSRCNQ
jgi:hypothetical protein